MMIDEESLPFWKRWLWYVFLFSFIAFVYIVNGGELLVNAIWGKNAKA